MATLLTPGAFEVEYATLSSDRSRVIYNSNQDDIDRRHLWAAAVAGTDAPTALTKAAASSGSRLRPPPARRRPFSARMRGCRRTSR